MSELRNYKGDKMDKDQKILVVYYSLTGNVKFIAEKISDLLNSDLKQISEISSNVNFTKIELLKYYLFNIKHYKRRRVIEV
jgi:flavodoxin